jgi:hypothetical protein
VWAKGLPTLLQLVKLRPAPAISQPLADLNERNRVAYNKPLQLTLQIDIKDKISNMLASHINSLKPSGYCMYRQFNIQQFYVLPTQCIYVFCVDLRTNCDYFPIQH